MLYLVNFCNNSWLFAYRMAHRCCAPWSKLCKISCLNTFHWISTDSCFALIPISILLGSLELSWWHVHKWEENWKILKYRIGRDIFLACKEFGGRFDDSFPACTFFKTEISWHSSIPLFRPGSVHGGSASWDDCGQASPDESHVSLFSSVIGSNTMLGLCSQPTPTSLGLACMPV